MFSFVASQLCISYPFSKLLISHINITLIHVAMQYQQLAWVMLADQQLASQIT